MKFHLKVPLKVSKVTTKCIFAVYGICTARIIHFNLRHVPLRYKLFDDNEGGCL